LRPARRGPASGAGRPQKSRRGGPFRAVTRLPGKIKIIGSAAILVLAAVAVVVVLLPQQAHVVSAPASLGSYVREPASADATAAQFRQKVIAGASGEVQHVVAAVYERTTGPGTSAGPQIIVFIGGNLAGGATAGGLMDTFMASLHGSFSTSPGRLGGQAACANGLHGGPAECAWADGDTFGVIVSATQGAASLAAEMRLMRPLVERPAK